MTKRDSGLANSEQKYKARFRQSLGEVSQPVNGPPATCARPSMQRRSDGRPELCEAAQKRLRELADEFDPLAVALAEAARRRNERGAAAAASIGNPSRVESHSKSARRLIERPKPAPLRPGTILRRTYQRREIVVTVFERGFEFEGRIYRSLSAIAKVITGAHWNGRLFFGLVRQLKPVRFSEQKHG
ncbi:MAG: DUF2924 domain-containing protein [Phycisphaerae bacterium]|nr:DUF2924 domain-containing protein [Phycisphaerae bacterium]